MQVLALSVLASLLSQVSALPQNKHTPPFALSNHTSSYPSLSTRQTNSTLPTEPAKENYNTAAWRSYIGFLVFFITALLLWAFVNIFLAIRMYLAKHRDVKAIKREENSRKLSKAYAKMMNEAEISEILPAYLRR
ncbi:hypothetical protein GQ44DRAFT_759429 [Phaeosphaeriaceae sp. PMI808]|nr:hypothetical protein GQ44DRAFT_759429 [Phaeosphaeriaceae sp. PMI808]